MEEQLEKIYRNNNFLPRLNALIDWEIFRADPTGRNDFWGDRKPRVADFVPSLSCHVLPFQGGSATTLNTITISTCHAII